LNFRRKYAAIKAAIPEREVVISGIILEFNLHDLQQHSFTNQTTMTPDC